LLGKQRFRPEILIPIFEIIVLLNIAPSSLSALKSWYIVHAVFGLAFGVIGLAAAHHHPVCFHDGDEARPDPDFGLCQLDAVSERTDDDFDSLLLALLSFGFHPLHHLFPTVCHSKLQYLRPILAETLKEFEEEIRKFAHWQLYIGLVKQVGRNKPNPFIKKGTSKAK
jgi:fatty acid desaturase